MRHLGSWLDCLYKSLTSSEAVWLYPLHTCLAPSLPQTLKNAACSFKAHLANENSSGMYFLTDRPKLAKGRVAVGTVSDFLPLFALCGKDYTSFGVSLLGDTRPCRRGCAHWDDLRKPHHLLLSRKRRQSVGVHAKAHCQCPHPNSREDAVIQR